MPSVAALAADRGHASWDRIRYIGGVLSARVSLGDPGDSVTLSSDRLIIRLSDGQALEGWVKKAGLHYAGTDSSKA